MYLYGLLRESCNGPKKKRNCNDPVHSTKNMKLQVEGTNASINYISGANKKKKIVNYEKSQTSKIFMPTIMFLKDTDLWTYAMRIC